MVGDDLKILLQEGEGTTLEYKESLSDSFTRELVAMANTLGGRILLGVRDDGTISGIVDSNSLRARLQDFARNCDPQVGIRVESVGNVIVVHIRESESKPVQCREGFFWRQGAVTQKLSRDEIREFFRREGAVRFDLSINPRFRYPEDFDQDKFEAWRQLSRISSSAAVEDVLVNIEVAERAEERLLFRNAGVLFFGRDVRRFFNQAYVTCILFRGGERHRILDRKDFTGGVVADIDSSLKFIDRNTRTAYRIQALRREEIGEYPLPALREAITNAVVHRDWFNEGANVFVEIYADRIDVVSPGGLPPGLSIGQLGKKSVRRNPLIADLLHRIDLIEKAGTGIGRMRDAARDHGSPEPTFQVDDFFTCSFRPLPADVFERIPDRIRESSQPYRSSRPPKYPPSTPQVTWETLAILSAAENGAPREALQRAAGLRDRKHFTAAHLEPLLAAGLLQMTSPEKPRSSKQSYRLTEHGREVLKQANV